MKKLTTQYVYGAGIQSHDLQNMTLLPKLDMVNKKHGILHRLLFRYVYNELKHLPLPYSSQADTAAHPHQRISHTSANVVRVLLPGRRLQQDEPELDRGLPVEDVILNLSRT